MIQSLVKADDPILRTIARSIPAGAIGKNFIKKLIDEMFETMRFNNGIGLAAPQIGLPIRLAVVQVRGFTAALINPVITTLSDRIIEIYKEGCLSLPGIEVEVPRPYAISLEYLGLIMSGAIGTAKINLAGIQARVVQHEIDHLNGKLITDYEKSN